MSPNLWKDIRRIFGANAGRYRVTAGASQEAVAVKMSVDRAVSPNSGQLVSKHKPMLSAQLRWWMSRSSRRPESLRRFARRTV